MSYIQRFIIKLKQLYYRNKNKPETLAPLFLIIIIGVIILSLFLERKSVCLIIDGKPKNLVTYQSTVKQVLFSQGIKVSSHDKLNPSLDSRISNNSTIAFKHAIAVKTDIDGKEITNYSAENNVEAFLTSEGIVLNSEDKVTPEKSTKLFDGIQIKVVRVEHKTISTVDSIPYLTIRKNDNSLPNTHVQTVQEGSNGEKSTIFDILYEDGKEISKKIINETVTKKAVDKVVVVGTFPSMPISRGGQSLDFKKVIKVKATAYYAVHGVGKTYTSTGVKAVRNPDGYSTIAVDPRVIPYGSKLFVEGYGFATASDTGTAIRGNWIDVYFNTYNEACKWAVKYVNVYILN